jgi:chromosomal replication initiation ATPase DnaA
MSDVLFEKRLPSFSSLAALPSNVEAIESALLFSAGLNDFVAVVGASGWGKTHLLNAVQARFRAEGKACLPSISAEKYLENQPKLDPPTPLILDDCDEVLGKVRPKAILRLALEQRVRHGRATMLSFTHQRVTRTIKNFLPHPREWAVSTIGVPEPDERVLLINHMASTDGLALSPSLVRIIAHQMHGNGLTIAGALKRLRLSGTTWLDGFSILRACGLLEPFFADNSSWDLKHKIIRAAENSRALFWQFASQDLATYTMLRVSCLSEADVARVLGMEPATAYLKAARFENEMKCDPANAAALRQFVDQVVGLLMQD